VFPGVCELQDPVNGSNMWSCFGAEIYGNDITPEGVGYQGTQIYAARGGKTLVFNNNVNSATSLWVKAWNDWCDQDNPHTNPESQDIHDTYFFGNRKSYNGELAGLSADPSFRNYCIGGPKPSNPTLNVDLFNQDSSTFDGSSGVGCGTLATMQAITTCAEGVGYWITNQSCSNLTGMVGINPTTPISGTLDKGTSTNTWTAYYTPYTYPHPLRTDCIDYPALCDSGTAPICHKSDSDCDGCISQPELLSFISRWYINNMDVTLKELIEAIGLWNIGCS
jgi:hypothetical protein